MIHAGTISTGSARTSAVVGAYWMSSISRLRIDDLRRSVTATFTPGSKASEPIGGLPPSARSQSAEKIHRAAREILSALAQRRRREPPGSSR